MSTNNRFKKNKKNWVKMPKTIVLPSQIVDVLNTTVFENPPKFKYNENLAKFYLYLVYKNTTSTFENESFETYVHLCATILKKYNAKYNKYFDYFKENGILESLTHIKNEKHSECTKYRFAEKIRKLLDKAPVQVSVLELFDAKLRCKWTNTEISDCNTNCNHLTKWLNPKLQIDINGAAQVIEAGNYSVFNKVSTTTKLTSITVGYFYASRKNSTDNRLHTNFTSLCADFRPFITYDGEDFVNYDIKNSQPFFLIVIVELIKELLSEKQLQLPNTTPNKYKNNSKINNILKTIYNDNKYPLMLHNLKQSLCSSDFAEEYELIKNWIINGVFYEQLGEVLYPIAPSTGLWERRIKKECGKNPDGNAVVKSESKFYELGEKRKMVKDTVFVILFGSVTHKGSDITLFEKSFPHFAKFLEILKTGGQNRLALLLQQVESATIIDYVTKEIAKLHPEMPMLTVHDSIAVPRSWSLKVDMPGLVQALVKDFTGLTPGVDTDYYCPECHQAS